MTGQPTLQVLSPLNVGAAEAARSGGRMGGSSFGSARSGGYVLNTSADPY